MPPSSSLGTARPQGRQGELSPSSGRALLSLGGAGRGPRAASVPERLLEGLLLGCALLSLGISLGMVTVLARETLAFAHVVPLGELLLDGQWTPLFHEKHWGIWPLVAGTFLTSAIALLVAVPLGVLAAIYTSEFAGPRARRYLEPALELLAGVPTIAYGYFALVLVTPALQRVMPSLAGFNALGAGIVLGIMLIPMIASLCEDALRAVPGALREAAHALGAGLAATVFRVVVPAARSGIARSVLLASSRAAGETMIVAIAAGQQPRLTLDPRVPIETMTAYLVQVSKGETPAGTLEYGTMFVVGAVLFSITFGMNVLGHALQSRSGTPAPDAGRPPREV